MECSEWSSRYRCKGKQFLGSEKNLLNQQTDEFTSKVLNSSDQNSDEEEQVPIELTERLCTFKQSDSWLIIKNTINFIASTSTAQNI